MPVLQYLQAFFEELRQQGIPVTTSQVRIAVRRYC